MTFDGTLGVFHGSVVGRDSVISFEGESREQLRLAFVEAVDEYLAFREDEGVPAETCSSR
ncbi:MAG: hypothetical protein OXH41_14220 [Chloroflexi bacterium]|nr:hypothetical protein [Chloroflexota bacterium]